MAGVRGAEINGALEAGDAELIAALAVIAMRRSGQNVSEDFILDMDVSQVAAIPDQPEDANPPE